MAEDNDDKKAAEDNDEKKAAEVTDDKKMPLLDHLTELRGRLLKSVLAIVVRCRHVKDRIHEVGLRFSVPVDPDRFVVDESDAATDERAA